MTGADGLRTRMVAFVFGCDQYIMRSNMERIAILFPSNDSDINTVDSKYADEYDVCESMECFYPVLYNEHTFAEGETLKVNKKSPIKTMYCIKRGGYTPSERTDEMYHGLKRYGYRPAIKFNRYYSWNSWPEEVDRYNLHIDFEPKNFRPYHRYIREFSNSPAWFPDLDTFKKFLPAVPRSLEGVLTDKDGSALVVNEIESWEQIEALIRRASDEDLDKYTNTYHDSPVWFSKFVDIATVEGINIEWRVFYYGGQQIYITPKEVVPAGVKLPFPPKDVLKSKAKYGFVVADIALDTESKWWILNSCPGEVATVPKGGYVKDYYKALANALVNESNLPEFCFSLVADVIDQHPLGGSGNVVKGMRHFNAGETVVFADAFWGMGAERCTVIGVPKYSDDPVGVNVDTRWLVNFRVKKITDKRFLKAIFTNRLREPFEIDRKTYLTCRYTNFNEPIEELQELADMFNARRV